MSIIIADVEVMECLQRPFGVRERTLSVPSLGVASTPTPHKLTHPTLSQVTFYSAQPTKTVPGHTGFLTFATLPPRPAATISAAVTPSASAGTSSS